MRTRSRVSGGGGESVETENGTTRSETAASTPASQKDGRRRKKNMDSQSQEEPETKTMRTKIKKVKKDEKPLYKESDKLLCYFNGRLYDAQILEVKTLQEFVANDKSDISEGEVDEVPTFRTMSSEDEPVDADKFVYYVHYVHWGVKWDEWVRSDCLKIITEDARREQEELKKEMAKKSKLKKTPKRKRKSQSNFNVKVPGSQGKPAQEKTKIKVEIKLEMTDVNSEAEDEDTASAFIKDSEISAVEDAAGTAQSKSTVEAPNTKPSKSAKALTDTKPTKSEIEAPTDTKQSASAMEAVNDVPSTVEDMEVENSDVTGDDSSLQDVPKSEAIGTPTVSEVTCNLEKHLASLKFIGKLKAAAFCKKLLQSYEQHFHYVMSPSAKEQVVKTMTAMGLQQHADVIHFTGLLKLIDWLEAGSSSRWEAESYEEFKKDDLSDLREIFQICAEYFEATKRFLLEKTKQLPAHLYSRPVAFGSVGSNAA